MPAKGQKAHPHLPGNRPQVGITSKGYPMSNPFELGLKGLPHDSKLANPYKVEIGVDFSKDIRVAKSELRIYGDSTGLGSNADPLSLGFMNRINAAYTQLTNVNNASENGRGVWRMCQLIQTASWTSGPDNLAFIVACIGLNDVARSGRNNPNFYKTLNKIKNCWFSMMLRPLQSTVIASGDATITRSGGTFNSYFANTVGGRFVQGTGLPGADRASFATAGVGATWTWTTPTCRHLYIQFIGASGVTYTIGEADIIIDGVTVGHYSGNGQYDEVTDGVYDNGRGVVCMAFWDLPNAVHTVQVVQTAGTGAMAIDFFSTITDNFRICPAFLAMEIPYITRQGYYGNPPGGLRGDRQSSNECSQIIKELMLFFRSRGYNYGYAFSNSFYSLNNCDTDGVHPITRGHSQLLQAILNAVKTYNRFQQSL